MGDNKTKKLENILNEPKRAWAVKEGFTKLGIFSKKKEYVSFGANISDADSIGEIVEGATGIKIDGYKTPYGGYLVYYQTDEKGKENIIAEASKGINSFIKILTLQAEVTPEGVKKYLDKKGFDITETIPYECRLFEGGYTKHVIDKKVYYVSPKEDKARDTEGNLVTDKSILTKFGVELPEEKKPKPMMIEPGRKEPKKIPEAEREEVEKPSRRKFIKYIAIGGAGGIVVAVGTLRLFYWNVFGDVFGLSTKRKNLGEFYKASGNVVGYTKDGKLTIAFAGSDISNLVNEKSVIYGLRTSEPSVISISQIVNQDSVVYSGDPKEHISDFDTSKYTAVEPSEFIFNYRGNWEEREDKNIAPTGKIVELNGKDHLQFGDNYIVIGDKISDENKIKLSFAKDNDIEVTLYGVIGGTIPISNRRNTRRLFWFNPERVIYEKK